MTPDMTNGTEIAGSIRAAINNRIPAIYLMAAQADVAGIQAMAALDVASGQQAAGHVTSHLAATIRAHALLTIMDAWIKGISDVSTQEASRVPADDRQTLMTGLLRKQATIERRWEQERDWNGPVPDDLSMETAGTGATRYNRHIAAIGMRQAAARCVEIISQSNSPWKDPMCGAWIISMREAGELEVRFTTDERAWGKTDEGTDGAEDIDVALEQRGREAAGEIDALMSQAATLYSRDMPTEVSPRIESIPAVARRWRERVPDPVRDEYETLWAGGPGATGMDRATRPVILVSMIVGGKRHIRAIEEPMPTGVTSERVIGLCDEISQARDLFHQRSTGDLPEASYHACGVVIRRTRRIAEIGMQCATAEMVTSVIDMARSQQRARGQLLNIIARLTDGDRDLGETLCAGTAMDLKLTTRKQAGEIIRAAAAAGLDGESLRHLCKMIGHESAVMLGNQEPEDLGRIEALMNHAADLGIGERAVLRMMDALLSDNQPFFHCQYDGHRFTLTESDNPEAVAEQL